MADFIIDKIVRLNRPQGKKLGFGTMQHGGIYVDFQVFSAKENEGIFASFPSYKRRDGTYRNQVRLASKEHYTEFARVLNSAWENAGEASENDDEAPEVEEPAKKSKAPF